MKYFTRAVLFLSSKAFLLWLSGGWITYYVLSAIWTEQAFAGFVQGISNSSFIQVPYLIFLIVCTLNVIRVSRDIMRRGKIRYLMWLVLPLGLILFFFALFLSINYRQVGQRVFGEGDVVQPPWVSEGYRLVRVIPGLRPRIRDTERDFGIFAHEPRLELIDRSSGRYTVGAFPPKKIIDTYYHILNFGLAPGIRLLQDAKIVNEGYIPLRILTFGSSDTFQMPSLPYRFLVSLEPEKTIVRGDAVSSQYNLQRPYYRVRVFEGDDMIHEGDSRNGIALNGYSMHFFEPSYWVLLEAVKDPALPLMRISLLLIVIGIPLYFMGRIVGRY